MFLALPAVGINDIEEEKSERATREDDERGLKTWRPPLVHY
jgi:hypothetical protein